MKHRICFVCLASWEGIQSLRARSLGSHLKDRGHQVIHLLPDIADNQPFATNDVRLISTGIVGILKTFRKEIREFRPTHIHFLNPEIKASMLSTLVPHDCKVIGDWEDWHAISRDRGLKKIATRFADWYMRKRSDIILTTSEWLAGRFQQLTGKQTHYIPYAALPREFPSLPNPFSEPTAVFMGSFNKNWDHDILLDAAVLLKKRNIHAKILLIGRGADLVRSKEFCRSHQLDQVEFSGFLDWDDMLNRLQWAHVLLFPIRDNISNKARCPFKVFQYAQAKRPTITCRVGEVPNFLNDKAVYVDSEPIAFAETIEKMMSEPRMDNIEYGIADHTWELRAIDFERALDAPFDQD